jgi:hypothetical protein
MTGQHLLLLLWTLWIVFALLSIADVLGVILALVFGLLSAALVLTGLASWRGYVIAWLIVHVLVAGYAVAVLLGWLRPASGRLGLRPLWRWAHIPLLQAIFGSVSFVGLVSVLYLRPEIPWKYRVDIWLMLLAVAAVAAAEYRFSPVSWRYTHHVGQPDAEQLQAEPPQAEPPDAGQPDQSTPEAELVPAPVELEPGQVAQNSGADATSTGNTVEGVVVGREEPRPPDDVAADRDRLSVVEGRLAQVEKDIFQHRQDERAHVMDPHTPVSDSPVWYLPSDAVGFWAGSDEPAAGPVRIELLRIARLTEGQENAPGRLVGITIDRRAVPFSPESAVTVRQVTTRAAERLGQDIGTYGAAQPITQPRWEVVSQRWVQAGSSDADTAARIVTDVGAALDSILRNKPVQQVFSWAGPPGSASVVNTGVAGAPEVALVGGIVVGTRSGQPVAVSACFRALTTDPFTGHLAAGIPGKLSPHGLSAAPAPPTTQQLAG